MRKFLLAGATALALSGCTAAQNAQFQADVVVFNQDVAAINSAIAGVSATLGSNCQQIATVGAALVQLVGVSTAAGAGLAAADAAIVSYCQAVPQDIPQAVTATAAAVKAAQSAYSSAKAGN